MLVLDTSTNTTTTLVHNLYYKAIYAGNKSGGLYTFELTGKDTNADRVNGDIHIEGNIITSLNGHSTLNSGNDKTNATGTVQKVDALGNPITNIANAEPASDSLTPPLLDLTLYTAASRQYKSWDATSQGAGHDVVHVGTEYEYYQSANQLQTVRISQESGTNISGTSIPEWNTKANALPDTSAANFFMEGYQNHFAKPFSYADDQKMAATKNYYIGSRNTGTSSSYGKNNTTNGTGYGGGHSVIPISKAQNNKVYYVEGNLWLDSDGSNHFFFVPGPDLGNEPIRITIVAKGNIYIGDQIFVHGDNESKTKANEGISTLNSNWGGAISQLNSDSAIALIAMGDGESYDDANKNGKYDASEQILGRPQDPNNPSQTIPKPEIGRAHV